MLELLQKYSISDILIFIVILAVAIKGVISFIDFIKDKIKKSFNKGYNEIDEKKKINAILDEDA